MRIAVLSDIHANLHAFKAVVKDLKKERPNHIVFLGDLIVNGLYPKACYDLLYDLNVNVNLNGNTDLFSEYFLSHEPANEAEQYCKTIADYALDRVPNSVMLAFEFQGIYESKVYGTKSIGFCHGTPFDVEERSVEIELSEKTKKKLLELELNTLLCGHTHIPAQFMLGDMQVINFGAVGYSFDRDTRAAYGILEVTEDGIFPIQKRVPYDIDRYLKEIKKAAPPFEENLSYIIEHAHPRGS